MPKVGGWRRLSRPAKLDLLSGLAKLQTAKQLADDLRERVKLLGYERYKFIIQVAVGQKTGQAMRIVSRCLWVSRWAENGMCELTAYIAWLLRWLICSPPPHTMDVQDAQADDSASAYYENETLYCVCQVYGLYYE